MENKELEITHDILVSGPDADSCKKRVLRFFDKTQLVKYDSIHFEEGKTLSAEKELFWTRVTDGIAANRRVIQELADELKESGFETADDLPTLPQGYQSKILHTITHILDGFIGIDSRFYNLEEDSHWLSEPLREKIKADPTAFWLVAVQADFQAVEKASLIHQS